MIGEWNLKFQFHSTKRTSLINNIPKIPFKKRIIETLKNTLEFWKSRKLLPQSIENMFKSDTFEFEQNARLKKNLKKRKDSFLFLRTSVSRPAQWKKWILQNTVTFKSSLFLISPFKCFLIWKLFQCFHFQQNEY